jgi:DNA ligase 1
VTYLARLVETADAVAEASARTAKRDLLAVLLVRLEPDEVVPAVGFLIGEPRQGRVGVGWATLASVADVVATSADQGPTVADLDHLLDDLGATGGPGSNAARLHLLGGFLSRASAAEAAFVRRLLLGDLRQGALEGVMVDAVARAAEVPVTAVRRAAMLSGDLRHAAAVALTAGRGGLDAVTLTVGCPVQPMLAATSEDVGSAVREGDGPVSVEWKLDGARVQIHRVGEQVHVFTRNLNEVTDRLPDVVAAVRALPAERLVLDGEVLSLLDDDRPRAFQDTMSRFGRELPAAAALAAGPRSGLDEEAIERGTGEPRAPGVHLRPFFFDVLHLDGTDLVDAPLRERIEALEQAVGPLRIPGIVTADESEAAEFLDVALSAGHEGVMVKGLDAPYQAGRRGKTWRKVKPVRLFDLVVLAAEWGYGRRQGWLSNLHLGARDPTTGGFVMVGKTFKGLTDALLTWQTAAFLERELGREGHVVHVRPELIVEIALDGVQASTRYPGGVALRFARVKRYRPDKTPDQADTIESLQALLSRP